MNIKIGDIIKVVVNNIEKYGIFVNLEDGRNGLIHISEVCNGFVNNIFDFVVVNEEIYAKVIEIDEETNFVKFSIKNINYRKDKNKLNESISGFSPLADKLDYWVEEKLEELKKDSQM